MPSRIFASGSEVDPFFLVFHIRPFPVLFSWYCEAVPDAGTRSALDQIV